MTYYFTFYVDHLLIDKKYSYAQSNLFQHSPEKLLKFYELCFNSFLQNTNKECYILVNDKSYFYIKKYTDILDRNLINFDFLFQGKYKQVWSLPKLNAYQYICNMGKPFVFFDLDMIMVSDLPEDVLNNKIFVNEWVPKYQLPDWDIPHYINFLKNHPETQSNQIINSLFRYINYDYSNIEIPNCSIFGGSDLNKINTFVNLAINHCLDPLNKDYWEDDYYDDRNGFSKACMLEQLLLGLFFHDKLNNKSQIIFLKDVYFKKGIRFPINHIAHDKYYLYNKDISAQKLFDIIYKIFKKYTLHYTHLLSVPRSELKEFNFSTEDKKVLKIIFKRFLDKNK